MGAERQDDVYAVLGVERGATPSEIDRAYRRAARATHPDARPQDPAAAAEEFRHVTAAYETLRDPARRAAYDRAHPAPRVSRPAAPGGWGPAGGARRLRVHPPVGGYPAHPPPWTGPVEIGTRRGTAGSRPSADDDLARLAALLVRLLRSPW